MSERHLAIGSYLSVSTRHITEATSVLMDRRDGAAINMGLSYHVYDEGFWVFASEDTSRMNRDIACIIENAKRFGCTWIRLDPDGYEFDELPQYDW